MLSPRLQQQLVSFQANDLLRQLYCINKRDDNVIWVSHQPLIQFCSNDYLHLATHKEVKKACIAGIQQSGLGSGASAQVAGFSRSHQRLEQAIAEFLQRDRALVFNSGYHANLGVMTTFANRNSLIVADKYCHASLIDGMVLSRAQHKRYRHNDLTQADQMLTQVHPSEKLLVTESIFSMQGDISNIKALSALALKHQAMLVVDDAHGIGLLGPTGRGIIEQQQLSQFELPCLITPFGKALGSFGAAVTGANDLIEALLQFSRTHRYSTALPPAICDATLVALNLIQQEAWRRQRLQALIEFFHHQAAASGLTLYAYDATPIKLIRIGSNQKALALQYQLIQAGFFVSCIRSPTLPLHSASIRVSLNCMHTEMQITELIHRIHDYVKP